MKPPGWTKIVREIDPPIIDDRSFELFGNTVFRSVIQEYIGNLMEIGLYKFIGCKIDQCHFMSSKAVPHMKPVTTCFNVQTNVQAVEDDAVNQNGDFEWKGFAKLLHMLRLSKS